MKYAFYPLFLFFFVFLALSSCKKDEPQISDYIVFGHFYGMCVGEDCVEIFKVQDGILYEDDKDVYPGSDKPYEGNFNKIPDAKYQKVKNLRMEVPSELTKENEVVIGMPDAGDWGGIYLEIMEGSEKRFWLIDKMEYNLPDYLKPFVAKVNDAIEAVK